MKVVLFFLFFHTGLFSAFSAFQSVGAFESGGSVFFFKKSAFLKETLFHKGRHERRRVALRGGESSHDGECECFLSLSLSLLSRAHAHTFAFFYTRVDFF